MSLLINMIENSEKFNGHNQINISPISNKKLLKLYKKLSNYYKDEKFWLELRYCYSSHMLTQLSASIYKIMDTKEGGDILLCSFDEVTGTGIFKDKETGE